MIFVRTKDGISHNPAEYARPEDCAAGAQVLLGAYLRYDDHIRQKYEVAATESEQNVVKNHAMVSQTEIAA